MVFLESVIIGPRHGWCGNRRVGALFLVAWPAED
jgi:hypothetical protein